jgi:hypothetical protein
MRFDDEGPDKDETEILCGLIAGKIKDKIGKN